MTVPATLNAILALPDILDTARGYLFFPMLPGAGDNQQLTLLSCNVSLPAMHVGHIRVPVFGQTIAFRGHRDHGNSFTASFYETREAVGHYGLLSWLTLACSSEDDTSLLKAQYSVTCFYDQYDTVGDLAYRFRLKGVWPQSFTTPASSENSAASRLELTFSVDFIDLVAAGSTMPSDNYSNSGTPLEDTAASQRLPLLPPAEFGQFSSSALSNMSKGPSLPLSSSAFSNLVGAR